MVVVSLPQELQFTLYLNREVEENWNGTEKNLSSSLSSITSRLCDLGQVTFHLWVTRGTAWQRLFLEVPNPEFVRIL